jgi:hypothetical protein
MREKPTNTPIIHSVFLIMYGTSYMFRHYIAITSAWRSEIATHHVTTHNTTIHNILSTALQLIISQKELGTLPDDGNVMPKRVGATIHN